MSTALKVRKPKAVLLDFVGNVTKSNWIDRIIYPYVRDNVDVYLENNWGNRVLMRDIEFLRAESLQDGGPAIARPGDIPEKIRPTVVAYVQRCIAEVRNNEAIRIFNFHMIFDGYNRDKLHTSVYSDAAGSISKWASQGIDIHMLSNGWSYATEKFMSKTNHSDLTPHIKSYMDNELGSLQDSGTYKTVISKLSLPPEDILFITHVGMEGVAAHKAGLSVILVATHREDVSRERTDATIQCGLPLIRIFTDLSFGDDAPVASSMVDEEAMSRAVSASRASSAAAGGSGTHVSGSKTAMSGSRGSSSHLSGSKSASSVGSKGSSNQSGSRPKSAASGSKKSAGASGSASSAASGSKKSSAQSSGSKPSSAASGSKPSGAGSSSKGGSSSYSGK